MYYQMHKCNFWHYISDEQECLQKKQCIPVGYVPSAVVTVSLATHAPCHAGYPTTCPPLDRMTDTCEHITFPQLLLRMETRMYSSRMCATHTLPYWGSPWQRPFPGQRPPWTETPILNRDPTDRDPRTETPLDRDPKRGQTNTCENITFANFVCGR